MRSRRGQVALTGSMLALLLTIPQTAGAHDQGFHATGDYNYSERWGNYHLVGAPSAGSDSSCPSGEVNSRYVKSIKAILWAYGAIAEMSSINQTFNVTTAGNLKNFQTAHGLFSDGCAGYNTWDNMRYGEHWVASIGEYVPHLLWDGYSGCCGEFRVWQEKTNNRRVRYYKDITFDTAEPLCWRLYKAINDANGAETFYNHHVDHDGGTQCN